MTRAADARTFPPSKAHYHDLDSSCLESITAVPVFLESGADGHMVTADGWYRCTKPRIPTGESSHYYVHDHNGHFVSHYPRDEKAGCPA